MFSNNSFNSMKIEMTKHAKERCKPSNRNIHENEIRNCLQNGTRSSGHYNQEYQSRPHKNTAVMQKDGKYVQTTVVYDELEQPNAFKVITAYQKRAA